MWHCTRSKLKRLRTRRVLRDRAPIDSVSTTPHKRTVKRPHAQHKDSSPSHKNQILERDASRTQFNGAATPHRPTFCRDLHRGGRSKTKLRRRRQGIANSKYLKGESTRDARMCNPVRIDGRGLIKKTVGGGARGRGTSTSQRHSKRHHERPIPMRDFLFDRDDPRDPKNQLEVKSKRKYNRGTRRNQAWVTGCNSSSPKGSYYRQGVGLLQRLYALSKAVHDGLPLGTRMWVKYRADATDPVCEWPCLLWSQPLCLKEDTADLLDLFHPGKVLVKLYGTLSAMWVSPACLQRLSPEQEKEHLDYDLPIWAGNNLRRGELVEAVLDQLRGSRESPAGEMRRMLTLQKECADADCCPCHCCFEPGADIRCSTCQRSFHTLCFSPPALTPEDLPSGGWACPSCHSPNQVTESNTSQDGLDERMGLTPDWIIEAAAFNVFQLGRPTPEKPYIEGLLDPCTNSLTAPNIPAQYMYDKKMDGLKVENEWSGFVLLNPDYRANTLWRFVNRAIDEVENGKVAAIVLVCRNSTDSGYYQRLTPYPRVHLRRMSALFKDYSKSPIGFGIVVFLITKTYDREMCERFYDQFSSKGEPHIPIDRHLLGLPAFQDLLQRLREHCAEHERDHWVRCTQCGKWRIVEFKDRLAAANMTDWSCKDLRENLTSCSTPLSRAEESGLRYIANQACTLPTFAQAPLVSQHVEGLQSAGVPLAPAAVSPQPPFEAACGENTASTSVPPGQDAVQGVLVRLVAHCRLHGLASKGAVSTRSGAAEAPGYHEAMTPLELAREARIAANRAFLAALTTVHEGSTAALADGEPSPVPAGEALPASDPLVLQAAKELAQKAFQETTRIQWEHAEAACREGDERMHREVDAVIGQTMRNGQRLVQLRDDKVARDKALESARQAWVALCHTPS
eukprot:jgi/Botrbrau1/5600/Bobra.97_2s0025.2